MADIRVCNPTLNNYEYYNFAKNADRFVALDANGIELYENDEVILMRKDLSKVNGDRDVPVKGVLKMSPGKGAYAVIDGRAANICNKRGWSGRIWCTKVDAATYTPFIKVDTEK
jgi:hypothetical protein